MLVAIRLPRLDNALLDHNSFRQTQAALTAYWFTQEGIRLPDYPLPVLGYPWTAPMELPVFQVMVAAVHAAGVPMDLSGRAVGLAMFVAAVLLMVQLVLQAGAPPLVAYSFLGFAALSPFAIVWSRACMIEFCTVALDLLYLSLLVTAARRGWRPPRAVATVLVGSLGAASKITTFPVFWAGALVVAAGHLWRLWTDGPDSVRGRWRFLGVAGTWLAVLLLPVAAAGWWTIVSDAVKSAHPATTSLTSWHLARWNFGTFEQRLDAANWTLILDRVAHLVLPWTWPLALVGLVAVLRGRRDLALLVGAIGTAAIATPLVFFNLYLAHVYYLSAIVLPLWLLAAFGIVEVSCWSRRAWWRSAVVALPLTALLGASWTSPYVAETYQDWRDAQVVRLGHEIRSHTPPDAELVVFDVNWASRIPYYSRRKTLMVREPTITDEYVTRYVHDRGVRYVVANLRRRDHARELWPGLQVVAATKNYTLFQIPLDGSSPSPH